VLVLVQPSPKSRLLGLLFLSGEVGRLDWSETGYVLPGEFHIGVEVQAAKIPVGLLEDHVGEVSDAERKLQRSFAGIGTIPSDPQRPAAWVSLATRLEPGKTELPAASCRPE
jgi:hypothetical protein